MTDHVTTAQPVVIDQRPPVEEPGAAPAGHACGCGHAAEPDLPELDATVIPHALRHATILGALESLAPGAGLILAAPHDPLPLLAQIEARWPGRYTVDRVETGPVVWRLRFVRQAAGES